MSGVSGKQCLQGGNSYSSSHSGKKTLKFHYLVRMLMILMKFNADADDNDDADADLDNDFDIFSGLLSK